MPAWPIARQITAITGFCMNSVVAARPIAPISAASVKCHRRSIFRSDERPSRIMKTIETIGGTAEAMPICK